MIKQIIKDLQASDKPVIGLMYSTEGVKIRGIGMQEGMELKQHSSPVDGKLIILKGNVRYQEASNSLVLGEWDEISIKAKVLHSVYSLSDSVCLLIQG